MPTAHDYVLIAGTGMVSVAAVRRYFAGKPVRSTTLARVHYALAALGMPDRIPAEPDARRTAVPESRS